RLDPGDVGATQIAPIDPGFQLVQERNAQIMIASNGAGLDEGLTFPRSPHGIVIAKGRVDSNHRGALVSGGPQTEIRSVRRTEIRVLGEELDHEAAKAVEILAIADRPVSVGNALTITQEHQVDVTRV